MGCGLDELVWKCCHGGEYKTGTGTGTKPVQVQVQNGMFYIKHLFKKYEATIFIDSKVVLSRLGGEPGKICNKRLSSPLVLLRSTEPPKKNPSSRRVSRLSVSAGLPAEPADLFKTLYLRNFNV